MATGHSEHGGNDLNNAPQASDDWYRVTLSLPWIVHGVDGPQDAINIAVSELGKQIIDASSKTRNSDIAIQNIACPECEIANEAVLLVADTALVGLVLTVEVLANSAAHSEKVAKREIGQHLPDVPLDPVMVETVDIKGS